MSVKDPFNERAPAVFRRRLDLLGAKFHVSGNDRRLIALLDSAYAGVPRHRLSDAMPEIGLTLRLIEERSAGWREPPPLRTQGAAGLLCGAIDAGNFAALSPQARTGLVCFSRALLRFPYHARYELLEFAVFTLASRVQGLAPLHAGCVGSNGAGILLIGDSGAGKSTVALHCMLQGLEVLAEDAVFVEPATALATGIANFLHLREGSLRFLDEAMAARIRRAPVIRRRSGVAKFAVDLRQKGYRPARAPLKIVGIAFLSRPSAAGSALLTPVSYAQALKRLAASQPYASRLAGWNEFLEGLGAVGAFDLKLGAHPEQAARALRGLIQWGEGSALQSRIRARPGRLRRTS